MEHRLHQDPAAPLVGARQRLLHSAVSAYASTLLRLLIAFGTRYILARLILPESLGLWELALRVVVLLSAVRDLGLTHHLMRDPRESYGAILAWSCGVGALLSVGLVATAGFFSRLDPDLPNVLRALAVWIVLDAVIMVYRTFFERRLRIREIAGFEVLRGLLFGLFAIAFAWTGAEVWAFVGGELLASAAFALLLLWRARGQIPLAVDWRRLPGLLRASRTLFMVWVAFQVFTYVDVFLIAAFDPLRDLDFALREFSATTDVGYYAQAYAIAFLVPLTLTPRPLLPALVAFRDETEQFAETLRLGTLLFLSGIVLSAYFLFFNVEKTVGLLLGQNWKGVEPLLRILCLVPLVDVFTTTGGEALKVLNRDRLWLGTVALNMTALVVFGFFFTSQWGPEGMAWANYLRLGSLLMLVKILGLFAGGRRRRLVGNLALVYLLPLPFFLAAAWLLPADSWGRFAASLAAVALGGGALVLRFLPDYRRFFAGAAAGGLEPVDRAGHRDAAVLAGETGPGDGRRDRRDAPEPHRTDGRRRPGGRSDLVDEVDDDPDGGTDA